MAVQATLQAPARAAAPSRLVLWQENCGKSKGSIECQIYWRRAGYGLQDRYGLCCNIYSSTNRSYSSLVLHTRDPVYPEGWKQFERNRTACVSFSHPTTWRFPKVRAEELGSHKVGARGHHGPSGLLC